VVWLDDGRARLIQARERPEDLVRRDRRLGPAIMRVGDAPAEAGGAPWPPAVRFAKYQALGNDYVVLDPADLTGELTASQVQLICDRHYGIGADGVLLGPLEAPDSDFGLRLFNPDGGEFEKSGNGLRIFSRYLWDAGLVGEEPFTVETPGGEVTCRVHGAGGRVTVMMGQVSFHSRRIPVTGPPREVLEETMVVAGRELRFCAATIGNPHCVVLCDEVSAGEARELGPLIERDDRFPNRTNVQFMRVVDRGSIQIEIWERGAGYTLASGSSSCAAAAVAHRLGLCEPEIRVHMPGGEIAVTIGHDWTVTMEGAVAKVCAGTISREMMEVAAG
jgi:diaminopimelate epimerase